MKYLFISFFVLFCTPGFSQYKPRNVLDKEFFIGTWKLTEVRTGNASSKSIEDKTIHFTKDSVFIISGAKHYAGTWTQKKSQLYITIPNTTAFNYKWVSISQATLCLRVGNDFSRIECYRKNN